MLNATSVSPSHHSSVSQEAAQAFSSILRERWPQACSVCEVGSSSSRVVDALAQAGFGDVRTLSVGESPSSDRHFDVVIALGVAETLPMEQAESFVAELCGLGDLVVFAAAVPGQTEGGVANEQWPSYWVERFAHHGMAASDSLRSSLWEDTRLPAWCRQNLLTFTKGETDGRPFSSFDVVHPETFTQRVQKAESLSRDNKRLVDSWLNRHQGFAPAEVHWCRIVMNAETKKLMQQIDYPNLSALEISGAAWRDFGFKDFTVAAYPDFDVTKQIATKPDNSLFDVVIAEQVMEHVPTPWVAVTSMHASLNPGGYLLITAPFFIRVHAHPGDYTRWTEYGLRNLLEYAGFAPDKIQTGSWGNRACVAANFVGSVYRAEAYDPHIHSLENEPDVPIMVWVFAQK